MIDVYAYNNHVIALAGLHCAGPIGVARGRAEEARALQLKCHQSQKCHKKAYGFFSFF